MDLETRGARKEEERDRTGQIIFTIVMIAFVGMIILCVALRILVEHFDKDKRKAKPIVRSTAARKKATLHAMPELDGDSNNVYLPMNSTESVNPQNFKGTELLDTVKT